MFNPKHETVLASVDFRYLPKVEDQAQNYNLLPRKKLTVGYPFIHFICRSNKLIIKQSTRVTRGDTQRIFLKTGLCLGLSNEGEIPQDMIWP